MKPEDFFETNVKFGQNQTEYLTLPAYKDDKGQVVTKWRLSFWERLKVLCTGRIWFLTLTFNNPLQPIRPTLDDPFEVIP